MMKDQLEPYKDFVRPHYAGKNVAHNFKHIERIIARLNVLSEGMPSPPRLDRLYFLACFHGLGARLQDDDMFREQTAVFLDQLGWTPQKFQSSLKAWRVTMNLLKPSKKK